MDFNTGVVVGWCMARGKKGGGGGGSAPDIWKPPDHWLTIPEPADNQAIFYVEAPSAMPTITITFWDAYIDNGNFIEKFGGGTIDWGDGYVDTIAENYSSTCIHPYQKAGAYIITVTCNYAMGVDINQTTYTRMYNQDVTPSSIKTHFCLRAIKTGADVVLFRQPDNSLYKNSLIYIKYCGRIRPTNDFLIENLYALQKIEMANLPSTFNDPNAFSNCYSLHDINFLKNYSGEIPSYAFQNCISIKSVDMPNVTSVGNRIFQGCTSLTNVNLPNVSELSPSEFDGCYNLRSLNVAEGCNFNGNTFDYCPALYPKPQ